MKPQLALAIAIAIIVPATAHADEWSNTLEFANAQTSSIRIVEPEGYTVTINGKTDTVPAVFAVNNANNYFLASFQAPDGSAWSKKLEVKEYRQTVVRVRHVKSAATPPASAAPKAMSYVGTVTNTTNKCEAEFQMAIKLEFRLGPDVIKSAEVKSGGRASVELVEGSYSIRRYQLDGSEWVFDKTEAFDVRKDGWQYDWGCSTKKRRR